MASVVYHAFHQIRETGQMKLFRSHHPDFGDGEQARDFIYVRDVVDVIQFMMEKRPESGLYNLGTGLASTFRDLVKFTFEALDMKPNILFIDTPEDIREKYQYFTQADMNKLISAGYLHPFTTLQKGVKEYVSSFLMKNLVN
jgi:ADP-L-glycero-D-manno-heptose 6-epimerase